MPKIPPIHRQVNVCATLLGETIARSHGKEALSLVEHIRKHAAQTRGAAEQEEKEQLFRLLEHIDNLSPEQNLMAAKAFSIYLVLINACENAYRTSRLKPAFKQDHSPLVGRLIFVLTAHPTEVRSAPGIALSRRITGVLLPWFSRGAETGPMPEEKRELAALIGMLWHVGIHKTNPVTPPDEVDHIAGQFCDPVLSEILYLRRRGADLRFRTWVGGDKDGHPGITATTLHTTFRRTRLRFYRFFENRMNAVKNELQLLGGEVSHALKQVERALLDVRRVTAGDGIRMNTLRYKVTSLHGKVEELLGEVPLMLMEMSGLLELFPAMVLPVELREESTVFLQLQKKNAVGTIGKMLRKAAQVSEGDILRHYVQGLIISMTRGPEDLEAAVNVVERAIGRHKIRIIPLFERGEDLDAAPETMETILKNQLPILEADQGKDSLKPKLEIMLGYSDTSKRMGAFASRRRIIRSMHELTGVCNTYSLVPIFFHGAGGSVTRGGGSIKEQFASWPAEARRVLKFTVQGEMVERTLATPAIFRRNVERLLATARTMSSEPGTLTHPILDELADISAQAFHKLTHDKGFLKFLSLATPYPDLSVLHLGSRPSHRPGKTLSKGLSSLRAIPWVLCFTQVRLLVPSWYGIGTAFEQLRQDPEKFKALREAYKNDNAFKGVIKLMGFSLAKGDRAVFSLYTDILAKEPGLETVKKELLEEEERVRRMVSAISGEDDFLWFRPWLGESILLRGSTIHPLSVIEVMALRNRRQGILGGQNDDVLRTAVAGSAIGMLTTG